MPLPAFDSKGDLPEGVHKATIEEVLLRFGSGSSQRRAVTANLMRIYQLAASTGKLNRLVIFGSYVTAKSNPRDVDVVIVFDDDFDFKSSDEETKKLLNHTEAEKEFGASVFWIRPSLLIFETLDKFVEHWQVKRDQTFRGIIEVRP